MGKSISFFAVLLLGLGSLAGCYLTGRPGDSTAQVPSDFFAVAHAGSSRSAAEYGLVGMLGAKTSRIDLSWNLIEPQQGTFDFSGFDPIVATAASKGIDILAILDYDVPWIHSDGQSHDYVPPDRIQDWLGYVVAVVGHYKGQVKAYEIWNEPNGSFWTGTMAEFAAPTRQTAAAIRTTDPAAIIGAGAFLQGPRNWARAMLSAGSFYNADFISFHPYSATAETVAQMSMSFMSDVRSMGYTGKFWITEVGFATRGIYPWTVSNAELPSMVAKTAMLLAASEAEKMVWYTLADTLPLGQTSVRLAESSFGLGNPDYTPKNGAYAYRAIQEVAAGSTYESALVENNSEWKWIHVYPLVMADGRLGVVAWASLPARIEFSKSITATMPRIDGPGEDAFSGQSLVLSDAPIVLVTQGPVDTTSAQRIMIHKVAF